MSSSVAVLIMVIKNLKVSTSIMRVQLKFTSASSNLYFCSYSYFLCCFSYDLPTLSSTMASEDDVPRLEDGGGGDEDDKVWGMPKYELNHLGNLTDEEYLAAVSFNS